MGAGCFFNVQLMPGLCQAALVVKVGIGANQKTVSHHCLLVLLAYLPVGHKKVSHRST